MIHILGLNCRFLDLECGLMFTSKMKLSVKPRMVTYILSENFVSSLVFLLNKDDIVY